MAHPEGKLAHFPDNGRNRSHGLRGLGRDALFLTRHLPNFFKGGSTLAKSLITSTWKGGPDHRFDEVNLRDRKSRMNLVKQVLFTALTPIYGTVRGAVLLWENNAFPAELEPYLLALPPPKVSYPGDIRLWDNGNFRDERWYFINGICTDKNGLKLNCQRLEDTFHRPVQGIHNETNGFLVDLAECFAQRNLNFSTSSARFAAAIIKEKLVSTNDLDVVLIGHSQGGIIVSMVLDSLADDRSITDEQLAHVRCVVTFGSAADEFHHPLRRRQARDAAVPDHDPPSVLALKGIRDRREVALPMHIEHFANEHDLVAQLGPLQFFGPHEEAQGEEVEQQEQQPRHRPYAGRLFVAERSGHLFNTSYSLQERHYQERHGNGEQPFFFQLVGQSIREAARARSATGECGGVTTPTQSYPD